jgi:hypothetical protein
LLYLGLGAALMALAACESNPSGPEAPEAADLELTLEQMAAEANSAGDPDAAVAFNDGLSALRFGVRPTDIAVKVGDEIVRYNALVVGVIVRHDGTHEVQRRSLIAWTGQPRPSALLHATSFTDEAEFSFPSDLATDAAPDGRARGTWANLARGHRFVATSGPVKMVVRSRGDPCPSVPADAPLVCVAAKWDVRLEGTFKLLPRRDARSVSDVAALVIAAAADDMNGVVLSRR